MSALKNECRFCLKILKNDKKTTKIDEEIRVQFENITHVELLDSEKFSNFICEICLRSLNLANAVKEEFCENQKKLYEDSKIESEDQTFICENEESVIRETDTRKKGHEFISKDRNNEHENLETVIKIEKEEVEQIVNDENITHYNNQSDNNENLLSKPTVSWNFTNKKGVQLNKEEKKFWQSILDRVGSINSTVLYIIQMNGYNNSFSFQGHFEARIDNNETIDLLEQSVRCLDAYSEHLNSIELSGKPICEFSFSMGQRCAIIGLFEQMRKMIQMGNFEEASSTKIKMEKLQQVVEDVLRRRLRRKTLDFPICKCSIDRFPYTLWIPCVKCQKLQLVTVSELTKPNGEKKLHVRTLSYAKHVEDCDYVNKRW